MRRITVYLIFFTTFYLSYGQTISHSPIVGGVTSSEASFVIRTENPDSVKVELSSEANFTSTISSEYFLVNEEIDGFVKLVIENLSPATKYYYRFYLNEILFDDGRERYFKTFPIDGTASNFMFTFGSGQQERFDEESYFGNIFPVIAQGDNAFFIEQGDWTYPDSTDTPADPQNYFSVDYNRVIDTYKARYTFDYPMYVLLENTPIAYTYDDHDVSDNDCDSTYPGIDNSIKGFIEMFPGYNLPASDKGIWHKFTYGNSEVFMVDNRSKRSPNIDGMEFITPDSAIFNPADHHTILGTDQMNWLLDGLKNSDATWKFISSGTPFNPGWRAAIEWALSFQGIVDQVVFPIVGSVSPTEIAIHAADKWSGFPNDIIKLISFIIENQIENVIFLTGDSHNAGLDDGTNSVLPELMDSGLDRTNGRTVQIFEYLGIHVWNRGGHTLDLGLNNFLNSYGRVTVFGDDSVKLEAVSEDGTVLGNNTVKAGYIPVSVHAAVGPEVLFFGEVDVESEPVTYPFNIISTSSDELVIQSITLTDDESFSLSGFELPLVIPAQKKESIFVTYNPSQPNRTDSAYIEIRTNAPKNPYFKVRVFGNATGTVNLENDETVPKDFVIEQNFPNPFNPMTIIKFSVPRSSDIKLKIYNALGEEVMTLVDGYFEKGSYEAVWYGDNEKHIQLGSGIYIYNLIAESKIISSKKMILLR